MPNRLTGSSKKVNFFPRAWAGKEELESSPSKAPPPKGRKGPNNLPHGRIIPGMDPGEKTKK